MDTHTTPPPGYISAREAAEEVGRSVRQVQHLCQKGHLDAVQVTLIGQPRPAWYIEPTSLAKRFPTGSK